MSANSLHLQPTEILGTGKHKLKQGIPETLHIHSRSISFEINSIKRKTDTQTLHKNNNNKSYTSNKIGQYLKKMILDTHPHT